MRTITTTDALAAFCEEARRGAHLTVDTEFMRERTYYARLCLIQLALPGDGEAVLVDPLADGLDLAPLYALFREPSVVKVFHAARQDIEIFATQAGVIPDPLFDTQVAAMVCGYGDQVSYETLVRILARTSLDKSSRFTDWARRPLSEAQKAYAIADVTHLRVIYEALAAELERRGRGGWVAEEIAALQDPASYTNDPAEAWRRVKSRNGSARLLAYVRELARFREAYAQTRNVPRSRVFKDDALLEIAAARPARCEDLARLRLLSREARKGEIADGILAAVAAGRETDPADLPRPARPREGLQINPAVADLLRVLLKARAGEAGVAAKLIASSADLDALAGGMRDVAALSGWRRELFGDDALRLCEGDVGLRVAGEHVEIADI